MLRTGVDLIEITRIQTAITRHGERFLARVYTQTEQRECQARAESLAARFAAKEAVAKALGTGIWRQGIDWTDIEIVRDPHSGAPHLVLYRAAADHARKLALTEWSVSLSHDRERAIAFVVAMS
jgi:holo-[acyl-carrier protein] synthase